MSQISAEDIQKAAIEVRRGGFGDFMFRNPSQNQSTAQKQITTDEKSRRSTSIHVTSNSQAEPNNSFVPSTRSLSHTGWRNSPHGNTQMNIGWENGNMWELRIRKRK